MPKDKDILEKTAKTSCFNKQPGPSSGKKGQTFFGFGYPSPFHSCPQASTHDYFFTIPRMVIGWGQDIDPPYK
uniref:Ovule protein n=1 Tax=Bursaphelenchus xylophilus TaxID=6326 RepID=A0A1I7RH62_BURXY